MSKPLLKATREDVYNAPIIPWNNGTYTPLPNSQIMNLIDTKIHDLGLLVQSQEYKVAVTQQGLIKGVIGSYNVATSDGEFGQKIMFRNSYDKSMSFAVCMGTIVWICENGSVSGDYQYKRVHRGVLLEDITTTERDVIESINGGFQMLQASFEHNVSQLNELKHYEMSPDEAFQLLGQLFFIKKVITISQMSIIKKELEFSHNFRHLGDTAFTAFDLYNHITESLKTSHPSSYINDHIETHSLFEHTFNLK